MLLGANAVAEFFASDKEKAAYETVGLIDKIRVGHNHFDGAIKNIRACIKQSVFSQEASNCMLLGEGGMGKTSISEIFKATMKKEVVIENDLEISTVPTFYTSFKSSRTLDALTTDMLKKLNDPHPDVGTVAEKAARARDLLKRCHTAIVFIDELHDLEGFEKRDVAKMKVFIKWIKELCNERGPVICLMGITSCYDIFKDDPEMARRFKRKFLLKPLTAGTEGEPGLLHSFVNDICREIVTRTSIQSFPSMSDYLSVLRIFVATGGSPDFVMTLIKEAVLRVLLEGRNIVELDDFALVWKSGLLDDASIITTNPFHATHAQIAAAIRRKNR